MNSSCYRILQFIFALIFFTFIPHRLHIDHFIVREIDMFKRFIYDLDIEKLEKSVQPLAAQYVVNTPSFGWIFLKHVLNQLF